MALTDKEKQATIALLEAKIEKATGKKITYAETKKVTEKWEEPADIAASKKGMFKNWTLAELKAEDAKLKKKEKKTDADTKRLKELNFAIRAKTGWGKVTKEEAGQIKDIHERLEKLTGKKIVFTEGTWALPEMPNDAQKVQEAITDLEAFKEKYWNIVGDDELYDHIDNAIKKIRELANAAMNKHVTA